MTAAPVMSITEELVAELEAAANAAIEARVAYTCTNATGLEMRRTLIVFQDSANPAVIRALLAERAELKKCADEMQTIKADMVLDAERYRFLRDLSEQLGNSLFSAVNEWLWGDGPFQDVSEAIDAAKQAAQ
jgi:hypothetical protein